MIWSSQQERALRKVGKWKQSPGGRPYFTLAGYAGTGKTTLARHFAADVAGDVFFAAYTGKAAHVLQKTGIPASTIHKLIYLPRDKCHDKLASLESRRDKLLRKLPRDDAKLLELEKAILEERSNLNRPEFTLNTDSPLGGAALCVIDEYSMVDAQTGRDLLSFGCPILALGDPGQLPPIQGAGFFGGEPDVLLDEIHRQAADNPIIRMSRDVREGKRLLPGEYGESRVVKRRGVKEDTLGGLVLGADQLLVGMNRTRRQFNHYMRQLLGRKETMPMAGDKLVCLRNNSQLNLLNGQLWTVTRSTTGKLHVELSLMGEDDERVTCVAHAEPFLDDGKELDPRMRRAACEFDFGYALTVHKAQGSQWDSVVLVDEWRGQSRKEWLYTGITRAAERITIIQ